MAEAHEEAAEGLPKFYMTTNNALEKARELMDMYEVVPRLSETRVINIHAVYDAFPEIVSYLESVVAENEKLRHTINKEEHLAAQDGDEYRMLRMREALALDPLSPLPQQVGAAAMEKPAGFSLGVQEEEMEKAIQRIEKVSLKSLQSGDSYHISCEIDIQVLLRAIRVLREKNKTLETNKAKLLRANVIICKHCKHGNMLKRCEICDRPLTP